VIYAYLDTPTEIDDSTAFNSLERNEDSIPGMGMTSLPIEINQKFSQQTTNPIKAWKSLPESGAKKRRQTLRRTVSKRQKRFQYRSAFDKYLRVFKFVMKILVLFSAIYQSRNNLSSAIHVHGEKKSLCMVECF